MEDATNGPAPADGPQGPWVRGRRLGIDLGKARIGVAVCDPDGLIATPVATVRRDLKTAGEDIPADIKEIAETAREFDVVEIVVGLPVTLSGEEGPAAAHTRAWVERFADHVSPTPVTLTDERMTTAVATRRLNEGGVRGKRKRSIVDQAAAVEILQHWLDRRRR
ncbi:Holliday junction resolvase RuvX [Glycomyces albidus]|jgi:putative Holliday junction resolvase|uniref:Putative pre-16S rRNA nuclease n=1 Tax=Glycomyces albidus TaxID=2656774 RepID=A0A6L5GB54_9ACTN|nr:Holliday junction resolvase RuvX [Glycomyces albidus]MQM26831.1 Holliday junction resolvase RuvX [Glycomyces albidus]